MQTPANVRADALSVSNPFSDLGLVAPLVRALAAEGYTTPTPIQQQAIPPVLAGRDLLGCAQTGTGKTAAFALPILQRLAPGLHALAAAKPVSAAPHRAGHRPIRALILSPTRELASQIEERFRAYGRHTGLRSTVIFGGVGQMPQVERLRAGVDILVATPGRLLDLMQQGYVELRHLECFVLDEADRMLDMGFIHDVKKVIAALPARRQSLFFSATMPRDIEDLAATILTNPVRVAVTPVSSTAERIAQSVYFVSQLDKPSLLLHLLASRELQRVLVFTRTKHGANKVAKRLDQAGIISAAIHGNKSQSARESALEGFKNGTIRVLVATDIAARGIDVESISHVINFDLPNVPESYVHRIGRTARAGAEGIAMSLCAPDERPFLVDIEKLTRQRVPVIADHPFAGRTAPPPAAFAARPTTGSVHAQAERPGNTNPNRRRRRPRGRRPAAAQAT
ncbi:MAG: DEAD/DEAH box helicase [Polyangia bacterium]